MALAGPPFRTDDPEGVEYQHWEMNFLSQGTHIQGSTSAFLPAYEVNYGALPQVQLHAILPVGFLNVTGSTNGTGFALGDVELGVKYRFVNPGDDDWYPQVGIFPLIEVPTGNQSMGLSTGHPQYFIPLWLQKDFDPWTVYGGGGYWINPGAGNRNYGFMGIALWRKMSDALNLGIEVFHQTSPAVGTPQSTGFNVGLTYDFSERWHLLASAGTGMQNRTSTNLFSWYVAMQLTF